MSWPCLTPLMPLRRGTERVAPFASHHNERGNMHIVVTAGPTREFLDPVRFLSNRSTGRMGFALAEAAREQGHDVTLIHGPVMLPPPADVACVPVVSAADMLAAVLGALPSCDALLMCAAVADWRPREVAADKLKKHVMSGTLALERTADILAAVRAHRRPEQVVVGFAAETQDVRAHAHEKLIRKELDFIVANDVSRSDAGFGTDTNAVLVLAKGGGEWALPLQSKREMAEDIIRRVAAVWCTKG